MILVSEEGRADNLLGHKKPITIAFQKKLQLYNSATYC